MSLKLAAEHLKAQGRGPDTELVHMTKGEVQALKGIAHAHGGQLTVNPETGLTEAGFLSGILPMIAGAAAIALAPETGGASLALEPWMVGAGIGAVDYALTGSLKQGLLAGLGAYGGASMATSLASSGAASFAADAGAQGAATNAAAQEAGRQATEMAASQGADKAAQEAARQAAIDETSAQAARQSTMANIGTGIKTAAAAPGAFLSSNMGAIGAAAAPVVMGGGLNQAPTNPQLAQSQQKNPLGLKSLSPNFYAQGPSQPNPAYQAQYTDYTKNPYVPGAASGGLMTPDGLAGNGSVVDNMTAGGIPGYSGKSGSLIGALDTYNSYTNKGITDLPRSSGADAGIYTDTDPNTANLDAYNAALYRFNKASKKAGMGKNAVSIKEAKSLADIESDAAGGLMAGHGIGGYSDGGRMLKGPGDGMSDSIPAVIGNKQPARLADGEFVVPADVVSHLGNGSTEAGAKQLYAMMDKIRKARTGKKKQAPEVKAEKYLPK
jgi:hypothetical protein